MSLQKNTREEPFEPEPEFDSNDAGWDPYVASLLGSAAPLGAAAQHEEDEAAPVMTISRLAAKSRRE